MDTTATRSVRLFIDGDNVEITLYVSLASSPSILSNLETIVRQIAQNTVPDELAIADQLFAYSQELARDKSQTPQPE